MSNEQAKADFPIFNDDNDNVRCPKNARRCSKLKGHRGSCNKDNISNLTPFWKRSSITIQRKIATLEEKHQNVETNLNQSVLELSQNDHLALLHTNSLIEKNKTEKENVLQDVTNRLQLQKDQLEQFDKFKLLLDRKKQGATLRGKAPTTWETIHDSGNSTRYKRQGETRDVLEFIHGGHTGSIFGAWDYVCRHANKDLMEKLIVDYKRGKFIEKLFGKFTDSHKKSESAMSQALAVKYQAHLSRRKYNFICKVQKSCYDSDSQNWSKNCITYSDIKINLATASISHTSVKKFVEELDIGEIHCVPGVCGAVRTVTALTFMIVDLHLKVASLRDNLIWVNGIANHFIIEFSDDGVPETRDSTMSVGTLTLWNFGNRVRSRQFHYPLHLLTASEKDGVCSDLWKQHTDEMALLEGNTIYVNDERVTIEFQPSADQAWQFWSNNCLTQSATYPSLFANVHKSELSKIGGTIGHKPSDTWKPPTMASRELELKKLEKFMLTLSDKLTADTIHKKRLEFMAENGIRQLGEPRIGRFADRQRPEPLHIEINNWEHVLNLIYQEAVQRNCFDSFISTMKSPRNNNNGDKEEKKGLGLKFVAQSIEEHYKNEKERYNKLSARLIGSQAITLSRYGLRLVDSLQTTTESDAMKIRRLAIGKICESLRNIGALISKVIVLSSYPQKVYDACTMYFNLFSLFFNEKCQSTVWTLGYAVPYHVRLLYENYKIGYGVISMQGKESKHSALKQELKTETNRSTEQNEKSKWHQIMRSSYVRDFYLPYHFPLNEYHSHYESRIPTSKSGIKCCTCFRIMTGDACTSKDICNVCIDSSKICEDANNGYLSTNTLETLLPIKCRMCPKRFSDFIQCDNHISANFHHKGLLNAAEIIPQKMTIVQLKTALKERNAPTSGNKELLSRRLESILADELK